MAAVVGSELVSPRLPEMTGGASLPRRMCATVILLALAETRSTPRITENQPPRLVRLRTVTAKKVAARALGLQAALGQRFSPLSAANRGARSRAPRRLLPIRAGRRRTRTRSRRDRCRWPYAYRSGRFPASWARVLGRQSG